MFSVAVPVDAVTPRFTVELNEKPVAVTWLMINVPLSTAAAPVRPVIVTALPTAKGGAAVVVIVALAPFEVTLEMVAVTPEIDGEVIAETACCALLPMHVTAYEVV